MEFTAQERYEFKRLLDGLRSKKGRGTELISLYIPPDKQISDVTSQLREEYGQASNIKSRVTRLSVQGSLESAMSRLKLIPKPPENGVVLFIGSVDIGANRTELFSAALEPPDPIVTYRYHCDSSFYLEPLEEMLADKRTFGLIVLDRREAAIGLLKGKYIESLKTLTSTVPGKQRKGGQSSHRFQQLRLIAIHDFYKRIGESANDAFLPIDPKDLEGILIGGPSPTKEEFVEGGFLHHELQRKVLAALDVSYTDESGLYELVDTAQEQLADLEVTQDKEIMRRFMKELVSDKGLAAYGEKEVRHNLELGAVDVLLLSEDLRKTRAKIVCTNRSCDYTDSQTRSGSSEPVGTCLKCSSPLTIEEEVDIVSDLSKLAELSGAEVKIISTEFEEGAQLFRAFGGIAAILRYKTSHI
ncbi:MULTISPECIES: peptide chain release factor aRF-1 [Methanothrix]|jgi:peptide chain release factor subunit 1|uniref:Peptide chain release factor subunit 1 n=3 Tax=root TaxID=1 RepID=F4BTP4_METSG|nr:MULTISPECIES: peptide chain release factor aRF-1 [Methanothrix]NYT08352.1 peptide chain release factor 1 [Methanosarcinales archaeon]AEB69429.1 peptide chain release factor eRF/aRF, subunit 1 [Methanothrix soehngenii GP6]MBP7068974.1 peptide chain release factor aRF-1 [Methanothrix sp.]MDD3552028.1 peptide chain release factor aRF-1 [Methanothrix soehngenii]MDY0411929.1 peptide chain release factor aRF-1 [Methanothrix soehngenii]